MPRGQAPGARGRDRASWSSASCALNAWLFKVIPTASCPTEDQGAFFVEAQLPEGASVNRTAQVVERIEGMLEGHPGVADISTVVGYSTLDGLSKSNSAYFIVLLKPFEERTGAGEDVVSIIAKVPPRVPAIREANIIPFNVPPIIGLGTSGGFEYQLLDLQGATPADLAAVARGADLRRQPEPAARRRVHDLLGQHAAALPRIDRDKVQTLGINLADVFDALQATLGGYYVNDLNLFGRTWQLNIQGEQRTATRSTTSTASTSAT